MYRSCIFCSADLGANESIEHFPVGRSLAFDAAKGRLWAVCRRCARWNLAPLEERWESIEQAERLFRDARLRVQSENIGLTKLRDGTRLVRVGPAIAGELALFRCGDMLRRRRKRYLTYTGVGLATGVAIGVAGMVAGTSLAAGWLLFKGVNALRGGVAGLLPLARISAAETSNGAPFVLQRKHVPGSRLQQDEDGRLRLRIPLYPEVQVRPHVFEPETQDVVLHGDTARRVLARAMVGVNAAGAGADGLQWAVEAIARAESPGEYVMRLAREEVVFGTLRHAPVQHLALEMALHEDTERRAMQGELAALEEMWRHAEQIAAIADRLPDGPAAAH